MDIHISEWGWGFVGECFRRFQGDGVFFVFFVLSVIAAAIFLKTRWKKGLFAYLLFLALTAFNPILVIPLVNWLALDDEYYRFIWLLPVTVLIAWLAVYLVERVSKPVLRAVVCVLCIIVLAFPGKSILSRGLESAENLYKIPDEVVEVSQKLHALAEENGDEELRVVSDFDLVVTLNQYDPSIFQIVSYADVNLLSTYDNPEEYENTFPPYLKSQMHIYQTLYNQVEYTWMDLGGSFRETETDFVVMKKSDPMLEYILTQSCNIVDEAGQYVIMEFVPFVWDAENSMPIYE